MAGIAGFSRVNPKAFFNAALRLVPNLHELQPRCAISFGPAFTRKVTATFGFTSAQRRAIAANACAQLQRDSGIIFARCTSCFDVSASLPKTVVQNRFTPLPDEKRWAMVCTGIGDDFLKWLIGESRRVPPRQALMCAYSFKCDGGANERI
jgi:hypothetical protein